jgi:hypothetical protein
MALSTALFLLDKRCPPSSSGVCVSYASSKIWHAGVLLTSIVALVLTDWLQRCRVVDSALHKFAENSTDYSVMSTGSKMMWLPTSREEKYKAKQAIDTFFVDRRHAGGGVVFVGAQLLSFSVTNFALANIAFVLMAIQVAVLLLRESEINNSGREQPLSIASQDFRKHGSEHSKHNSGAQSTGRRRSIRARWCQSN